LTEGERTKTTADKTFQTKDPVTKPPDKNPHEQLRELYRGFLSGFFVLGLLKMGVSEMCDVILRVAGCVTRVGGQNWPKIASWYARAALYWL